MSDEPQADGPAQDAPERPARREKPDENRSPKGDERHGRRERSRDDGGSGAGKRPAGKQGAPGKDAAEHGDGDKDKSKDRDKDERSKDERSKDKDKDKDKEQEEREERERERERAAGRFRELTRDPLAEEESEDGPTDLAAAARARRAIQQLFDVGRDFTSFDRSYFHSALIGDVNLMLDSRRVGAGMRSGPVPDEELHRLRLVHVEPVGYVQLRTALRARRLLVLGAAPGTGRTSTALSLLDEVTISGPGTTGPETGNGHRVRRVDPDDDGLRKLADSLGEPSADQHTESRGYLLEVPLDRPGGPLPAEMDLDQLAAALARREAFAVVVVTVGSAAGPLLAGRYGMLCPPAPTAELLRTRLRERLEHHAAAPGADGTDPAELLARSEELYARADVKDALGLDDLRPAEAELLASLLAGHVLGDVTREDLLSGCRSLAAAQAQEWFAGVDRALTAPAPAVGTDGKPGRPGTAELFHPVAFRIALAVLGGAPHSAVAAAAHLLTWELSVQCDPDNTPARPLFCDDPDADVALSRAEVRDGRVEVAGVDVPARLIWYRGSALPAAVLTELWDRHFPARGPVVRWLRQLADDPRPQVWMRAAVAAGELCVRDFDHGYTELVRPLAEAPTPLRRIFAATTLDQAARHDSHRKAVHRIVGDWSRHGTKSLRWSAAMALGYGNAAESTDETLDALARIGIHGDGDQLAVASFNVVRLLTLPDAAQVLARMAEWTHHKREPYQDLGLVTTVRLALTTVDEMLTDAPDARPVGRGDWPLPLALAADRPELVEPMADLMWTAQNTARSQEVATDALESLLRSAVRKDGTEWTRPGLAALLPALAADEYDRRRLDWLLRRMMNDPEKPLPDARARDLWWLAVTPPSRPRPSARREEGTRPERTRRERTREEERHG
ncbi:hypothetical protein [Streptomyces sp. NPDC004042]|uniref:hypothetical protein n=1 Tax=Streptomyces sp. NPDC004042 TaxID=3154451 RepID=UPI0033A00C46